MPHATQWTSGLFFDNLLRVSQDDNSTPEKESTEFIKLWRVVTRHEKNEQAIPQYFKTYFSMHGFVGALPADGRLRFARE